MGYDQYTVPNDCSCRTYFGCFPLAIANIPCHSFKFLWRTVHSKPPTIPFGIIACTFSDNLPRSSCIRFNLTLFSLNFRRVVFIPLSEGVKATRSNRLKFRLTPHMLFFMDGCISGAISGSTYVTFVDVVWSKWNWKLKKGKNPVGLIRVDCCF